MRVRLWRVCGFALLFGALLLVERRRPLRRRVEPQADRLTRNASAGLLSALVVNRLEAALVTPLARTADRRRLGLLGRAVLPRPLRALVGFLLLDYTLYLWHVLNHRTAALWRFHLVHHVDLDLDVSTGIRFHFGEMALGSLFRVLQVLALGVDVPTLRVWEVTLLGSVLFHHSNLELPIDRERELSRVLVTPRMHGIHHSIVRRETDSNFSSLLAWWDWLHGARERAAAECDRRCAGLPGSGRGHAAQDSSTTVRAAAGRLAAARRPRAGSGCGHHAERHACVVSGQWGQSEPRRDLMFRDSDLVMR